MRPPPPLTDLAYFPVTGGTALLAIVATAASKFHYSMAPLEMNYLAFHGEPWRLITSAFPHADIFHIFFNLWGLWTFGSLIELRFGHVKTFGLYALLAAGSAAPQYAFEVGGIGLSGVVYGIFGLLWVLSRSDPELKDSLDAKTTQAFVIWFFVCIVLTVTKILPVANIAHGAGTIIGALVGWLVERRKPEESLRKKILAASGLAVVLGGSLWAATAGRRIVNFSKDGGNDLSQLALDAFDQNDNEKAVRYLKIATSMRYPQPDAWHNLGVGYFRLGRVQEAEQAFSKETALKGSNVRRK